MHDKNETKIINALADSLEIPDSAYEAAASRYEYLGKWLTDKSKSKSSQFDPSVIPQGSFSLGTATKPWKREDYDLDLVCTLKSGITKTNHSQESLKKLIGYDLDNYRKERCIQKRLEEKHRCWRLNYQDQLSFHMDITPSIPQSEKTRHILKERMNMSGVEEALSQDISDLSIAITDDRSQNYKEISEDWHISNPEGYAKWFEVRMRQAQQFLESRALLEKVAKVDDLPRYRWKTPLQRCIQILKRHRDIMFEMNPDGKPISIIITTLAARAYHGENDIYTAMESILNGMENFIYNNSSAVSNPVNPSEDFADRWNSNEGHRLNLKQNFSVWLEQAKIDFDILVSSPSKDIVDQALIKFGANLDKKIVEQISVISNFVHIPKIHRISEVPAKPWGFQK